MGCPQPALYQFCDAFFGALASCTHSSFLVQILGCVAYACRWDMHVRASYGV